MTGPRVPCRSCRSRIDQDWDVCPHCSVQDPHRDRRRLRRAGIAAAVVAALVVTAALVIPGIL